MFVDANAFLQHIRQDGDNETIEKEFCKQDNVSSSQDSIHKH